MDAGFSQVFLFTFQSADENTVYVGDTTRNPGLHSETSGSEQLSLCLQELKSWSETVLALCLLCEPADSPQVRITVNTEIKEPGLCKKLHKNSHDRPTLNHSSDTVLAAGEMGTSSE